MTLSKAVKSIHKLVSAPKKNPFRSFTVWVIYSHFKVHFWLPVLTSYCLQTARNAFSDSQLIFKMHALASPLRLPPLALVWPFSSLDRTLPQRHLHTGLYMIQRLGRIRNREELSFIHSGKFYQPRYRDKSCSYNQSGVKSSDQISRRIQFCRNIKTLESFSHQNKHFFSGEQNTLEFKREYFTYYDENALS